MTYDDMRDIRVEDNPDSHGPDVKITFQYNLTQASVIRGTLDDARKLRDELDHYLSTVGAS